MQQGITWLSGSSAPQLHCSVVPIELHHVHWVSVRMVESSVVLSVMLCMMSPPLLDPQAAQARQRKEQSE